MSDAMRQGIENPEPRQDLIREMREMAARGTSVRELCNLVRSRLDLGEQAVIDQLFYFTKAFRVPLLEVLPLREWLGTDNDAEIDAIILPAIEKTKNQWMPKTTASAVVTAP